MPPASRFVALGISLGGAILAGCGRSNSATTPPARAANFEFVDATDSAGIRFRHSHGGAGKKLMPETVGSGCAWLDFDGDGWQDLLFVNCSPLPGTPKSTATTAALYRNRGDGTFEDRTRGSGLDVPIYGQAAVAADYDGDGDTDVFITCLGPNRLFRNDGKGRFTDVTGSSGLVSDPNPWRWHTGAAWLDYDRDGRLDLFVARYVQWTPSTDIFCGIPGGLKRYCPPNKYRGEVCALYRNLGKGRFTDVSRATGVDRVVGKWFQPVVWDYNQDGWPDVGVSSDGTLTALFRNEQGKRFTDAAAEAGLGVSESGMAKAGMGMDVADWRNQGREAVLIGNFSGERLSLFDPDPGQIFTDVADQVGMGSTSLYSLTFGLAFLDVDRDGWRDAFIGNGHIDDYIEQFEANVTYAQRPLLYRNVQGQRFEEVGQQSGPAMAEKRVVRGCAVADYDRDGDPDIVVVENNRGARLYRNETRSAHHWISVALRGKPGNRDAIGARVEVTGDGVRQVQTVRAGGQFLSQSELPLLFGVGTARKVSLTITWPGGAQTQRDAVVDQGINLAEP